MTGANTARSPMIVVEQICGSDVARGLRKVTKRSDSTKMLHNAH
jgi:hypothetical protein